MAEGVVRTAIAKSGDGPFPLPVVEFDWANGQKVAISTVSAQSAALTADLVFVRMTVAGFIAVGANPTAADAAGSWPVSADEVISFPIDRGHKVAGIAATGTGTMYVMPAASF